MASQSLARAQQRARSKRNTRAKLHATAGHATHTHNLTSSTQCSHTLSSSQTLVRSAYHTLRCESNRVMATHARSRECVLVGSQPKQLLVGTCPGFVRQPCSTTAHLAEHTQSEVTAQIPPHCETPTACCEVMQRATRRWPERNRTPRGSMCVLELDCVHARPPTDSIANPHVIKSIQSVPQQKLKSV